MKSKNLVEGFHNCADLGRSSAGVVLNSEGITHANHVNSHGRSVLALIPLLGILV